MPKPKYESWGEERSWDIRMARIKNGYRNAEKFADALTDAGMKVSMQAYLRRERGETPVMADEIWILADTLGISLVETLELFSRKPDAYKRSIEDEKLLFDKYYTTKG